MSKRDTNKERARTARRRVERQAAKAPAKAQAEAQGGPHASAPSTEEAPGAGSGQRVHALERCNTDGLAADGLYDDCPICRAMRAAGAVPDEHGAVAMTPEVQARYEQAFDEIIATEGWPEDAVTATVQELINWFDAINEDLEAAGHPTDLEAMTDAELDAHWDRVEEASMRLFGRRGAARKPAMAS